MLLTMLSLGLCVHQNAAYNRQLPTVKYLLELGADTEVADVGARYAAVLPDSASHRLIILHRKPADLAILNSLIPGATSVEHEISKTFAQRDDYLSDFDFTPMHIAVLDMYDPSDHERPSLEQ